jgi:hypothetical protein
VWLVELSGLLDGALVPHTVAAAMGLRDQTARSMVEVFADHLADKRALLRQRLAQNSTVANVPIRSNPQRAYTARAGRL